MSWTSIALSSAQDRMPPLIVRKRVLKRDSYSCVYCDEHTKGIDHVIPWCSSGHSEEDNLVACCSVCNRAKQDKLDPAFLKTSLPYLMDQYPDSSFLDWDYLVHSFGLPWYEEWYRCEWDGLLL